MLETPDILGALAAELMRHGFSVHGDESTLSIRDEDVGTLVMASPADTEAYGTWMEVRILTLLDPRFLPMPVAADIVASSDPLFGRVDAIDGAGGTTQLRHRDSAPYAPGLAPAIAFRVLASFTHMWELRDTIRASR